MHQHMEEPAECGYGPSESERECRYSHVLDGGIGEQPLYIPLPEERKRRDKERKQPEYHHDMTRHVALRRAVYQYLAAHQSIKGDIQEKAREDGGYGRGAFAVRCRRAHGLCRRRRG